MSEIHFSKCECPGGSKGDPYDFPPDVKDACQCPGEHVSEIHSSKCKCPAGYDGDPYDFSQDLKKMLVNVLVSMCLKSILQNVNVPAAMMVILTIFLKN